MELTGKVVFLFLTVPILLCQAIVRWTKTAMQQENARLVQQVAESEQLIRRKLNAMEFVLQILIGTKNGTTSMTATKNF